MAIIKSRTPSHPCDRILAMHLLFAFFPAPSGNLTRVFPTGSNCHQQCRRTSREAPRFSTPRASRIAFVYSRA
jgi:hypothetical protein